MYVELSLVYMVLALPPVRGLGLQESGVDRCALALFSQLFLSLASIHVKVMWGQTFKNGPIHSCKGVLISG